MDYLTIFFVIQGFYYNRHARILTSKIGTFKNPDVGSYASIFINPSSFRLPDTLIFAFMNSFAISMFVSK